MKEKIEAKTAVATSDVQRKLIEDQKTAKELLIRAHDAMADLAEARAECKLSNTRVGGVARELKELIKVMAVYDRNC